MPDDPNINRPRWDFDRAEPPFRSRAMRVAHHAGSEELGATLFEIDPGGAVSPYHIHHGNEELLIVINGRPTLRAPGGERELEPGEAVLFPRGQEGAHTLLNRTEEPVRCLFVSTLLQPEVVEYPDSGKLGVRVGGERPNFRLDSQVDYWDGEEARSEA